MLQLAFRSMTHKAKLAWKQLHETEYGMDTALVDKNLMVYRCSSIEALQRGQS